MNHKRRTLTYLSIALLLIVVLVQCEPAPTPVPEFPDPQRFDAQALPDGPALPDVQLEPGQSLVPEQIVVTGPGADIDRVIGQLPDLGLERVASASFRYLEQYELPGEGSDDLQQRSQGKRLRAVDPHFVARQQAASLRIDLYRFSEDTPPLSETLQIIAGEVEAMQDSLETGVVAEPNYVMGFEITGDPWGIEGSPWGIEGSPWGIEGSTDAAAPHASDNFWQQWALQPAPGINLFDQEDAPASRTVDAAGEDVYVAVFDTSPFPVPGGYRFDRWGPPLVPSLALTVSHPVAVPQSVADEELGNISDHGLFVAGLAYAVAPQSDVHLIRVLNEHGQGTLQAFVDALNLYVQQSLSARGTLQNTVINLSLGTAEPDDEELPPEARRAIRRMIDLWGYRPLVSEGTPVFSLEVPMLIADGYGAVIVAASGNDSAQQPENDPLPSQVPAAYPLVLGVEASNQTSTRSCFANDGDLAAPGGEGGQLPQVCEPVVETCPQDEAACVVSYVFSEHKGYAYWVGTSFATPLVSGLSAAVLASAPGASPGDVRTTVSCAAGSSGVIDVVAALDSCP